MEQEPASLHQSPTIRPLTKALFFFFFCLAVVTVTVRVSESFLEKSYPATVVGYEVEVATKSGGKVVRIEVEKNQSVEQGQILAELKDETLELEIASASEEIKKLRDALEMERLGRGLLSKRFDLDEKRLEAENALSTTRIDMDQTARKLEAAKEALQLAIGQSERAQRLLGERALTRTQYEQSRMEVTSASQTVIDLRLEFLEKQAQIGRLEETLDFYENRKGELVAESNDRLTELEIQLRQREGELEALLARKKSLVIRAEQSGVISRDPRSVGEFVADGQPLFWISTGQRLWVEASIPANEADVLKEGDQVEIVAEKQSVVRLRGSVTGTLPILRTESRSNVGAFEDRNKVAVVMVEFANPEEAKQRLRPGQSVTVRRILNEDAL